MSFLKKNKQESSKKAKKALKEVGNTYKLLKKSKGKFIDDDDEDDEDDISHESIYANHLNRIKELEKSGLSGESFDIEVLKSLRILVLELIPIAEENYRKVPSHTAASALNQYINQEREILADIRQLEDFRARAERITKVFEEECENIAKSMIFSVQKVTMFFSEKGMPKNGDKHLENLMQEHGKEIILARDRAISKVMALMVTNDKKK